MGVRYLLSFAPTLRFLRSQILCISVQNKRLLDETINESSSIFKATIDRSVDHGLTPSLPRASYQGEDRPISRPWVFNAKSTMSDILLLSCIAKHDTKTLAATSKNEQFKTNPDPPTPRKRRGGKKKHQKTTTHKEHFETRFHGGTKCS